MMRVTNSMIVKRSKTNINANRANVDYTNNQMATQKKIVKPSDNPVIAIRALRLRSTLSTITQYYENNIPDTQAWMDCTETAMENMKGALKDAYDQAVYGATDELNTENRETILKSLQSLQQQIYSEGNADYAGRTIFTGYKTNQSLTFLDSVEAKKAHYNITERFDYKEITQKKYYAGSFNEADKSVDIKDTTKDVPVFEEKTLNRLRLSYDNITPASKAQNALTLTYKKTPVDSKEEKTVGVTLSSDGSVSFGDLKITTDDVKNKTIPDNTVRDNHFVTQTADGYAVYDLSDTQINSTTGTRELKTGAKPIGTVKLKNGDTDGSGTNKDYLAVQIGDKNNNDISYRAVDTTTDLKDKGYAINDDQIVFDPESGELIFGDKVKAALEENQTSFKFQYDKSGFETGELRPEHYFDCQKYVADRDKPIDYQNYDENDEWMTQAIYYNIAGGQQMQINTEAREVFDSNIRRDIDDLIEIVQTAISAQDTVNSIKEKIEKGDYKDEAELKKMNQWLDAANKQLDYANQNMHDTYSDYITRFQGYMDKVSLEVTDLGGRGDRVELTKNRMGVQKSTFKELKSQNEDMDLSDLVINYTAASVAYQAALQASAKIGQMTLLNFI